MRKSVGRFLLGLVIPFLLSACTQAESKHGEVNRTEGDHDRCGGTAAIVDSQTTWDEERRKALSKGFPEDVVERQRLIDVCYLSFDGRLHKGQIVMDERLEGDVRKIFALFLQQRFPIKSVIPISRFDWDDTASMKRNNTSGFNYRKIKGKNEWSNHAYGQAMDINTVQNPYVNGRHVSPKGAKYNKGKPGTFVKGSGLVQQIKALGWGWGGEWKNMKDYQHFEKVLH